MRLLVVRHGETESNVKKVIQGQLPGALTQKGIEQSKAVAEELAGEEFDAIYTSDLKRCLDTATFIAEHHKQIPLIASPHLREISFGSYEGKPAVELDWSTVEGDFYHRQAGGGESILQLQSRVMEFVEKISTLHSSGNVLLVTHGGPMRVIKANLERVFLEDLYKDRIENCTVWSFDL